jgi:pimeloyl-ACP methyl ester carboxylesterase
MAYGEPRKVTEDAVDEYWAPAQFPGFSRALRALIHDFRWAPIPPERLARVDRPALVVLGSRDRLVRGAPRLDRRIPGATITVVAGAGHAVNEEQPEAVNKAILAFLRQHGV